MAEWLEAIMEVMKKDPKIRMPWLLPWRVNPTTVNGWSIPSLEWKGASSVPLNEARKAHILASSKVVIAGLSVTNDVWVHYTVFALTPTYDYPHRAAATSGKKCRQDPTPTSVPASPTSTKPPSAHSAYPHQLHQKHRRSQRSWLNPTTLHAHQLPLNSQDYQQPEST